MNELEIVGFIIGAASFVLAVVFGVVTWRSSVAQKRATADMDKVLPFLERHIRRDIAQDEVAGLEKEVASLRSVVEKDLPAMARRVVLRRELEETRTLIGDKLARCKELQAELSREGDATLDGELERSLSVSDLLSDEESSANRRARNRDILLCFIGVTVGLSSFPEAESTKVMVGIATLAFALYVLHGFARTRADRKDFTSYMLLIYFNMGLGLAVLGYTTFHEHHDFAKPVGVALSILAGLWLLAGMFLVRPLIRWSREPTE